MSNIDKIIENNLKNSPISTNTINDKISQIINLISKADQVEEILSKNFYSIQKDQLVKLLKVLNVLSIENKNNIPFNNIINALHEIFMDGKIEIHEIPLLIKVLNENILKQNIKNISSDNISLLLKLIIIILVELEIIKLDSTNIKVLNTIIDTSLELLNIHIKLPSQKQLCKFFTCK